MLPAPAVHRAPCPAEIHPPPAALAAACDRQGSCSAPAPAGSAPNPDSAATRVPAVRAPPRGASRWSSRPRRRRRILTLPFSSRFSPPSLIRNSAFPSRSRWFFDEPIRSGAFGFFIRHREEDHVPVQRYLLSLQHDHDNELRQPFIFHVLRAAAPYVAVAESLR